MGLKEYRAKRDFSRTSEPSGKPKPESAKSRQPIFVIQKHAARRLHYDFRLEMEGVLKSWAVPKGLPMRRGDKRLAVHVEDHPLGYADFEGIIPPGNYGAGTVMVWDTGTYQLVGGSPAEALASGKLHLALDGQKLKGEWTLVRLRRRDGEDKEHWLVLKSGADARPVSAKLEDSSVLTQRTMEEIALDQSVQWKSNRVSRKAAAIESPFRPSPASRSRSSRLRSSASRTAREVVRERAE